MPFAIDRSSPSTVGDVTHLSSNSFSIKGYAESDDSHFSAPTATLGYNSKENALGEVAESNVQQPSWIRRSFQRMSAGSLRGSIFLLTNSALGAGILTLPYAFKLSGYVLGSLLLIFDAIIAGFTSYVLFMTVAIYKEKSYADICLKVLGPVSAFAVDAVIALNGIGMSMTLFVYLGDFVPNALQAFALPALLHNRSFLLTICLVLMWPMAIQKLMGSLKGLSFAILVTLVAVCATIITKSFSLFSQNHLEYPIVLFAFDWNFGVWYSICLFAYSQHMNVCSIAEELKNPTKPRILKVVFRSLALEFFLYMIFGLFGYFSWLGAAKQNFISNYDKHDMFVFTCRVFLGLMLIISVPLNSIAANKSVLALTVQWKKLFSRDRRMGRPGIQTLSPLLQSAADDNAYSFNNDIPLQPEFSGNQLSLENSEKSSHESDSVAGFPLLHQESSTEDEPSTTVRIVGATVILLSGYLVALFTEKVASVVGFVGGTFATSLICFFPAFLFYFGPVGKDYHPFWRFSLFVLLLLCSLKRLSVIMNVMCVAMTMIEKTWVLVYIYNDITSSSCSLKIQRQIYQSIYPII
ncbi:transmembrane amino acid transporter protein [Cardiosporidium cionae]|uniref:Transmembrane amino acid transporter protein n=1 Tax=Cardiosporidium cionae TaxID=476202 RepID=A0ABQ7JAL3_9APIC|nr:transmembrane amino acid transporter protein [Cardiosporidium cionae]|eukprot:KAF8820983.1 transmembrane amino acid transporter protein [Cardiosporidium cionae]